MPRATQHIALVSDDGYEIFPPLSLMRLDVSGS